MRMKLGLTDEFIDHKPSIILKPQGYMMLSKIVKLDDTRPDKPYKAKRRRLRGARKMGLNVDEYVKRQQIINSLCDKIAHMK